MDGHDPGTTFDSAFLASLEGLSFAVRRLRAREGDGRARPDLRGGRVEFADHRPYVPGDDPRTLDWAAWARTGRMVVKEYERDDELSLLVLVDASASMGVHGKLRAALRLAYALCFLGLAGGSRVRVGLCAGGRLELSGEVAGRARMGALRRFLAAARPAGDTRLTPCLRALPAVARGSRVTILVSDLLAEDDGREALATWSRRGDEIDVLHMVATADAELAGAGAVEVEDAETGERITVSPSAAQAARGRLAEIEQSWRAFAPRHRMRYVPLDAAATTEELVLRWLRQGGVLA